MQIREKMKQIPFEGNVEERSKSFQEVLNKYDPNATVKIRKGGGYLQYDIVDSTKKPNKTYLFNLKARLLKEKGKKESYIDWDDHEFAWTREAIEGNAEKRKSALKKLSLGYKIHLMPKNEYMLAVIDKILSQAQNDSELRDLISEFKILSNPNMNAQKSIRNANIVIYAKLGHENAQKLIEKLEKLFENFDLSEIAEPASRPPRRSASINNLIYYAQGGFDSKQLGKELLEKQKERMGFLTQHEVHYVGGKHLTSYSLLSSYTPKFSNENNAAHKKQLPDDKHDEYRVEKKKTSEKKKSSERVTPSFQFEINKGKRVHNSENYAIIQSITLNKDNSISIEVRSKNNYPGDITDNRNRQNTRELFEERHRKVAQLFQKSEFNARMLERSNTSVVFKIEDPTNAYKLLKILSHLEIEEPYNTSFIQNFRKNLKANYPELIYKQRKYR